MKIIRERSIVKQKSFVRSFRRRDSKTAGFSFDCDENGNLVDPYLNKAAISNFNKCIDGTYDVIDLGIKEITRTIRVSPVGICDVCGKEVELYRFTNTCECGTDYNSSGQRLAPREFWGEETGENLSDIQRIE